MKKIAVLNLKGGIGKTTTAVSLAYILAKEHCKDVLLIDCDMQGNASKVLNRYDPDSPGVHNIMNGSRTIENCIFGTGYDPGCNPDFSLGGRIEIIPANMYLMQAALAAYEQNGELNSKQATAAAQPEATPEPEPEPVYYGEEQQHTESICYRCTHWNDCFNKSDTTVKCGTFEDKNKKGSTAAAQPETAEKPTAGDYAREIVQEYKNTHEAQKAAEQATEPAESENKVQPKKQKHYIPLAAMYYDDVENGAKTFELRKRDHCYQIGDTLIMYEVKNGGTTERTITAEITYMLENYTGLADGYCILGIKVTREGGA